MYDEGQRGEEERGHVTKIGGHKPRASGSDLDHRYIFILVDRVIYKFPLLKATQWGKHAPGHLGPYHAMLPLALPGGRDDITCLAGKVFSSGPLRLPFVFFGPVRILSPSSGTPAYCHSLLQIRKSREERSKGIAYDPGALHPESGSWAYQASWCSLGQGLTTCEPQGAAGKEPG